MRGGKGIARAAALGPQVGSQGPGSAAGPGLHVTPPGCNRVRQGGTDSNGIAVEAERQAGYDVRAHAAGPQGGRQRQGGEHLRGIQAAGYQFVPGVGPGYLLLQLHTQPIVFVQAQLLCHDQWRAVRQAQIAYRQVAFFGRG